MLMEGGIVGCCGGKKCKILGEKQWEDGKIVVLKEKIILNDYLLEHFHVTHSNILPVNEDSLQFYGGYDTFSLQGQIKHLENGINSKQT